MKTVAVIGAGSSGLAAIKACKEEGIDVVCYEKTHEIGGLWRYHDDDIQGLPSVMKSTVINTQKEMSAFSDFPPPDNFPNYMHHSQLLKYFQMYADNYNLRQHIRYNTEVRVVRKSEYYEATGQWKVTVMNHTKQKISDELFDGVMVCSGHHIYPNEPHFEDQGIFQGKIIHSHSVKDTTGFENLNVIVVGIGNSAMDASVDISNVAKQVYLSTRRGGWVTPRKGPLGFPLDAFLTSRFLYSVKRIVGMDVSNWLMEKLLINWTFDHKLYGLKPKHRFLSQHPTINDYLPTKILTGRIIIKRNINKFTREGVIFEGENYVTPADVVILATGYGIHFPFLSEVKMRPRSNKVSLYKLTFPPYLKHPSFAFIGLIQPTGSIFPIAEAQSRWFAQVINGNVKLPDPETMEKEIYQRKKANEERYVNSPRHTIQVDYVDFMDDITSEFGAKPNMFKMAITDPSLFWVCLMNPCLPYQYRLQGPHSWSKAREVIMNFPTRIAKPFHGAISYRNYKNGELLHVHKSILKFLFFFLCLFVLLLYI